MFLIGLFAGMMVPLASGYLHHRMDSAMRATLGSFKSLGENAMLILTGLGFGYFPPGLMCLALRFHCRLLQYILGIFRHGVPKIR